MSGKRLRKLLLQSSELDEITKVSSSSASSHKKRKQIISKYEEENSKSIINNDSNDKSKEELDREKKEGKLKSQLESLLFYDHAFSRRASITQKSMKRKMNELSKAENDRKMMKLLGQGVGGTLSNSRSSSSRNARRKNEPTFDKKKDSQRKEIKSLKDLARRLKKK